MAPCCASRRADRLARIPTASSCLRDVLLLEGQQQELNELIVKARLKLTDADRPGGHGRAHRRGAGGRGGDRRGIGPDRPDGQEPGPEPHLRRQSAGRQPRWLPHGRTSGHCADEGRRHPGVARRGAKPADGLTGSGLPCRWRSERCGWAECATPCCRPPFLAVAMLLVAFGVLPVAGGFFAAAVVVVAVGALRMREAYAALDAPVLVLVAALIPVSDTVQASGGTDLIAAWLSGAFHGLPPLLTLTAMMAVAMAAHAVPEQRGHGADRGPDRPGTGQASGAEPGSVPDGRGGGGGLRLPHPGRPSVQHPGSGAGSAIGSATTPG